MKYNFKLPITGEITLEGSEEDLRKFLHLVRGCIVDAITFNEDYCDYRQWANHLRQVYECLPDPIDPDSELPF